MCEILCRGKTKIGSFWFEGAYVPESKIIIGYFEVVGYNSNEDLMDCKAIARKVLPETVGRYIGLTDKNGVKIFEGDIFQAGNYRFVIKFGKCGGVKNVTREVGYIGFYVIPVGKDAELYIGAIRTDILYWLNTYEVSIIGNIHDNPELLNAERNDENVDNGR